MGASSFVRAAIAVAGGSGAIVGERTFDFGADGRTSGVVVVLFLFIAAALVGHGRRGDEGGLVRNLRASATIVGVGIAVASGRAFFASNDLARIDGGAIRGFATVVVFAAFSFPERRRARSGSASQVGRALNGVAVFLDLTAESFGVSFASG